MAKRSEVRWFEDHNQGRDLKSSASKTTICAGHYECDHYD
jgi:hypothetical protein